MGSGVRLRHIRNVAYAAFAPVVVEIFNLDEGFFHQSKRVMPRTGTVDLGPITRYSFEESKSDIISNA